MVAQFEPWITRFLASACVLLLAGLGSRMEAKDVTVAEKAPKPSHQLNILIPSWTRSYELYGEPHAIWLSEYSAVGVNVETLRKALLEAAQQKKRPEIVVYSIPFRDMGQSSRGGFDTFDHYLADNRLNAEEVAKFVDQTGIRPRVYLEPDALAHAIQYRVDRNDDDASRQIYQERVAATRKLIELYRGAGALVYLDAAHSNWFDYSDAQIQSMADALNLAGIVGANGLVTNVSNRQPVAMDASASRTEAHYLNRLLPKLINYRHLDVVVDTSRNGGATRQRHYFLSEDGDLIDNEVPEGRLVGTWKKDTHGERWVYPFFGKPMKVSILTGLDKYKFSKDKMVLSAPPWLDAVGDVQLGHAPTDNTGLALIHKYRYIKPPDDCDGSLNCPPGWSKSDLNEKTQARQKERKDRASKTFWADRLSQH